MSIWLISLVIYIVGIFVIGIPMAKKSIVVYENMCNGRPIGLLGIFICPFNWFNMMDVEGDPKQH